MMWNSFQNDSSTTLQLGDKNGTTFAKSSSGSNANPIETLKDVILDGLQNLYYVLQEMKDGKVSIEQAMDVLVASTSESIHTAERMRLAAMEKMMNNKFESDEDNEPLLVDYDVMMKKVPALTRMGVPLTVNSIRVISKELAVLDDMFAERHILSYKVWGGNSNTNTLLRIPKCTTKESFFKTNKNNNFVERLPSLVHGFDNDKEMDARVGGWIMEILGKKFENELVNVVEELGYNVKTRKMEYSLALAMWEDANVNSRSQRTLLRYINYVFGKYVDIPATKEEDDFGDDPEGIAYSSVDPMYSFKEIEGETINYWTKPLSSCISSSVASRIYSNKKGDVIKEEEHIETADLIFGGDHGQGMFRMVVKIIVRNNEGDELSEFIIRVAHIDCKKDTYNVLRETICPQLNEDMRLIQEGRVKLYVFQSGEGKNAKYSCQICNVNEPRRFISPCTGEEVTAMKEIKCCDMRIFITGDLAFYAAVLGKVNMSGKWCTWCKLHPSEWEQEGHEHGEQWTLEEMRDILEQLNCGILQDTPRNRKGIVQLQLFDCIPLKQYILPVLHSEIGLGNGMLNSFMKWVDLRIEEVMEDESEIRKRYSDAVQLLEIEEEKWNEFTNNQGVQLANLTSEYNQLKELGEYREDDGSFLLSLNERKEIDAILKTKRDTMKPLKRARKMIQDDLDNAKKEYNTQKKELDKYSSTRGKKGQVRQKLEKILRNNGIHRPSYHGGDLTGTKVKQLLQEIDVIFGDNFKDVILAVPERERLAKNDEVELVISMYRDLGLVLDGVFAMARIRSGKLTDEDIELTRRFVRATLQMWRKLRLSMQAPKIHGIEDHLVDIMILWGGIGSFVEDFVEQAHQFGVKDEVRTRGLNRSQAYKSHSKWEWRSNRVEVMMARLEMIMNTKRKSSRKALEKRAEKKAQRIEKRLDSLNRIESGHYSTIKRYR